MIKKSSKKRKRAKPLGRGIKARLRQQLKTLDPGKMPISHPAAAQDAAEVRVLFEKNERGELVPQQVFVGSKRLGPQVSHQLVRIPEIPEDDWRDLETKLGRSIPLDQREYIDAAGTDFIVTTLYTGASSDLAETEQYLASLINAGDTFLNACTTMQVAPLAASESREASTAIPDELKALASMAAKASAFEGHPLLSPQHAIANHIWQSLPDAHERAKALNNAMLPFLSFLEHALMDVAARKSKKGTRGDVTVETFVERLMTAAHAGAPLKLPSNDLRDPNGAEAPTPLLKFIVAAFKIWGRTGVASLSLNNVSESDQQKLLVRWRKATGKRPGTLLAHCSTVRARLKYEDDEAG